MAPKNVHVLIPRICKYITLRGKRYFAVMIKLSAHRGRVYSWIIQVGPSKLRIVLGYSEREVWLEIKDHTDATLLLCRMRKGL